MIGLKNLFNKKNYAKEFKDAFENGDIDKVMNIIPGWLENSHDDANLTLAMVILGSLNGNMEFTRTFELYMSASNETPGDPSLHDWFNSKAIELMEKRADDEMGFSDMFNNKYKNKPISNDYAREFLRLLEEGIDGDGDNLDEMHALVGKWEEEYPMDANVHCAYVILNAFKCNVDDRIGKAEEYEAVDRNSYTKLLALMYRIVEYKS